LLDSFDAYVAENPDDRRRLTFLILAATVARTPDVPLPTGVLREASSPAV